MSQATSVTLLFAVTTLITALLNIYGNRYKVFADRVGPHFFFDLVATYTMTFSPLVFM